MSQPPENQGHNSLTKKSTGWIDSTVTTLLQKLVGQWNIDPAQMSGKRDEIKIMVREYGIARATAAVTATVREHRSEFCPNIAIIRGYIPPAVARAGYCGKCTEGFIEAPPDINGNRQLQFCECTGGRNRANRVSPEILGQAPSQQEREHKGHFPAPDPGVTLQPRASEYERKWMRDSNPDSFFGEADVICMYKIALERKTKKLKPLPFEEMITEVLKVRHQIQDKL